MKRLLALLVVLWAGAALAVPPTTNINGVSPLPYQFTPVGPGQHNIAPTVATALVVPAGAVYATICVSTATVRYTTDGTTTPTATIGQPLPAGSCMSMSGPAVLAAAQFFSSTGTLDYEFFR